MSAAHLAVGAEIHYGLADVFLGGVPQHLQFSVVGPALANPDRLDEHETAIYRKR